MYIIHVLRIIFAMSVLRGIGVLWYVLTGHRGTVAYLWNWAQADRRSHRELTAGMAALPPRAEQRLGTQLGREGGTQHIHTLTHRKPTK